MKRPAPQENPARTGPHPKVVDDQALLRVLKALAEPRRLRMVQELAAAGELSCGELGKRFPIRQPTMSHHLRVLRDAGLLVVRREGLQALVSVNQDLLDRVLPPLRAARAAAQP
jgi:ArsR family transcriptional regulator